MFWWFFEIFVLCLDFFGVYWDDVLVLIFDMFVLLCLCYCLIVCLVRVWRLFFVLFDLLCVWVVLFRMFCFCFFCLFYWDLFWWFVCYGFLFCVCVIMVRWICLLLWLVILWSGCVDVDVCVCEVFWVWYEWWRWCYKCVCVVWLLKLGVCVWVSVFVVNVWFRCYWLFGVERGLTRTSNAARCI